MKRLSLAIILACFTLVLAAQDVIRVNYKGAKPTISDFAWAFLSAREEDDDEDCIDESFNAIKQAWDQYRKGLPQDENNTLTVDQKNGYVVYEYKSVYEGVEDLLRIQMCYWNEADQKHKLFAYNVACYRNGVPSPGQFDGLLFYRYNNATKKMTITNDVGFDVMFGTEDGAWVAHDLPRVGKDIKVIYYWDKTGKKKEKTLRWKGRRFSY